MGVPRRVLFLPGASGAGRFWQPAADRLPSTWEKVLFDWPGLGNVPADSRVRSFDDLADLVLAALDSPADLVAQSMGGLVAIKVALARPQAVRRLVLVATSGGVDLGRFDVADWRTEYRAEYPHAAAFVTDPQHEDLTPELARITAPALLLWADGDTISPPAVGRYLASQLTGASARLVVLEQGDHMFARDRPERVAALIEEHLALPSAYPSV
jgi:pimeloyl-ACP methyl ester carboxylesterase